VGEAPYDTVSDAVVDDLEAREPGNTTSTNEFLPRSADFETWHEGEARGFWLYDRMFPDAGWVAGQVMPWSGQVGIHGVSQSGLSWVVDVSVPPDGDTGGGGVLAFHQLAFPGWRAWVDGRPVAIKAAPLIASQAFSPGFILVAVPAGDHRCGLGPDDRDRRDLVGDADVWTVDCFAARPRFFGLGEGWYWVGARTGITGLGGDHPGGNPVA
ncbi:MAG: hypothetical protein EBU21_16785, partial [Proteobacteria bacterium]|nr:hypothetical protein [Pseudomonadota bacterium]